MERPRETERRSFEWEMKGKGCSVRLKGDEFGEGQATLAWEWQQTSCWDPAREKFSPRLMVRILPGTIFLPGSCQENEQKNKNNNR